MGPRTCVEKLDAMKGLDAEFDEYRLSSMKKEITIIENALKEASLWEGSVEDLAKFRELEKRHEELLKLEETMWRQRSRAMWLKEGDRNTKFFHNKASQRKKVNEIKKIKDEDGVWWRGEENVERVMISYFDDLFASSNPSEMEEICSMIRNKLNEEMKDWCNSVYSEEDVHEALMQMHPLKSPGPDGLPALFFQKYWGIVGRDVTKLPLDILNNNRSPEDINKTFIVLIPKGKNPVSP